MAHGVLPLAAGGSLASPAGGAFASIASSATVAAVAAPMRAATMLRVAVRQQVSTSTNYTDLFAYLLT